MKVLVNRFAGAFQLVFVVSVVGAAILLSVALKPDDSTTPKSREGASVSVAVVEPILSAFRPTVALNGVVEARTATEIVPQVSGKVIEVAPSFRAGSRVAKGDVLFQIDPSDYELAVEQTLAEIESAKSDLALLEAQAAAERQVWDQQFPDRPIPDLIAKVPQIAAAKARIRSGEASRRAAELSLERTVVKAPFDARILETRLDIGQVVATSTLVGSIFSIDSLEVAVPVSMDELALIGNVEGRSATVFAEHAKGTALAGTVVRMAAALDERTRLGTLHISVDDREELMLGEFVRVEISGEETLQTYKVPGASLTSRDQIWVVQDGRLVARRVEVLGSDADHAVVRAFDSADGVVALPPSDVRDGLPVTVRTESKFASSGGSLSGGK